MDSIIYSNIRVFKDVEGEYSNNAKVVDVLKNKRQYFFVYEKEEVNYDNIDYVEITKYIFYESGSDWVK